MPNNACNIVVRMSGGLGNQLFQLSSALYVASTYPKSNVWLDTRFIGGYETFRNCEVSFLIKYLPRVHIATASMGLAGIASRLRLGRLLNTTWGTYACIGSSETLKGLQVSPLSWVVLDGYFQYPDFVHFAFDQAALFAKLADEFGYLLDRVPSVSGLPCVGIHIRRGDYVSTKAGAETFQTIPLDYYRAAIKRFSSDAKFCVFGDNPELVSSFANEIGGIDIPSLGLSLTEEFMLLTLCDHYIIANSTFSWWASYLGWQEGKRVISPRDWYLAQDRNKSNPLLLPYFELL